MRTRYLIAVFLAAAASCTILNEPDRGLVVEWGDRDAGPDGEVERIPDAMVADTEPDNPITLMLDGDLLEGGEPDGCFDCGSDGGWDADAGSEDAGPPPVVVEECTDPDGEDEDGNGLANCADFACAGLPDCCVSGNADFDESWGSDFDTRWNLAPSAGTASLPLVDGGWIVAFQGDGQPSALVRQRCTPMALGVEITAEMRVSSEQGDAGAGQESYATVVLTASLDALPGKKLADDLAVVLEQDGLVRVTAAGVELARSVEAYPADHELLITITVTPAADASTAMLAEVTVKDLNASKENLESLVEQRGFVSRTALVSDVDGCREVDGLLVGVQGEGDAVQVGRVAATTKECINPSQFRDPPPDEMDALSAGKLGYGTWASGYVGAPSLINNPVSGGDLRWDVMVEASNAAPELETWTHVGYALGHAYATDWDAATWSGVTGVIAGNDPPSCIGQGASCVQGASLREPGMYGVLTSAEELNYVSLVYAGADQLQTASPVEYSLYGHLQLNLNPVPITGSTRILSGNEHGLQCDSLRDPHIVPVSDDLSDGYWLFFTCESASRSIYVTRVPAGLNALWDPVEIDRVLGPENLGPYAAGGVWGPEVVVTRDPGSNRTLFRLWFMARNRIDSAPVIGMAQGQAGGKRRPAEFVPYEANPVLTAESPALGGPCDGYCTLRGMAITPCHQNPTRLRLLVARRLLGQNISESQLIPLDQIWNSPWD